MIRHISSGLLTASIMLAFAVPANADPNWNNGHHYGWDKHHHRYDNRHYDHGYGNGYGTNSTTNTNAYVDARQSNASTVIQRGLANGQLTRREADRLFAQQQKIDSLQARFSANGRLSSMERDRLNNEVSRLQSELWHELNNRRIR